MEYGHKSVLLAEVSQQLVINTKGTFVDCTLGGAGHAKAILESIETEANLVGIDQDIAAINTAKKKLENFSQQILLIQGNFKDLDSLLTGKVEHVDGFLFDLGVSSYQLDLRERGFSYKEEGPLDMRMDADQKLTAYDIVNGYSSEDLYRVIKDYGEERWASRITNFIVSARERSKIQTTVELVGIIKDAIPASARRRGPHPAKRTFQALRIEVNDELKALESALWQTIKWLKKGARIVVISFHSLEDRIVKHVFKKLAQGYICKVGFKDCEDKMQSVVEIITKKPIRPGQEEIESNPRARSAKLRVAQRV